jgi:hypothetical protein
MTIYRVQGPDGKTYRIEGPDGASPDEVIAQAQQQFSASGSAESPAAPADDSRLRGFAAGLTKPIDKLAELTMKIPGVPAIDRFLSDITGTPDVATHNAQNKEIRDNNTRTGYQMAGNIVGTLPTALAGGGPIRQGALGGLLLSDKKDASGMLTDAAVGALASKAGDMVIGGAAKAAKPYVSKGAKALRDAGVPMTLGQLASQAGEGGGKLGRFAGRAIKGMEDRLAGLPIAGDIINPARQRGVEAYNKSVLNRALAPIGKSIPDDIPVGHDAIRFVGDQLSKGYDDLLPSLNANIDKPFMDGLQSVIDDTATLPLERQDQLKSILESVFLNRQQNGTFSGQALKDAETKLTGLVSNYSKSSDADQRALGQALAAARDEYRTLIERSNPDAAPVLQALNKGWRELTIAEKAAAKVGNTDGVFSPKQYANAALMSDSSVRRRATARGTRPNQELTDAAASILPNPVPDSGTAGRAAAGLLGAGALYVEPTTAAMMAAGTLPYTTMGQRFLNSLFVGDRGPVALGAANALEQTRRLAPGVIAPLTQYGGQ